MNSRLKSPSVRTLARVQCACVRPIMNKEEQKKRRCPSQKTEEFTQADLRRRTDKLLLLFST